MGPGSAAFGLGRDDGRLPSGHRLATRTPQPITEAIMARLTTDITDLPYVSGHVQAA